MTSANIKTMSDSQLIERVEYLIRRERELVECLIWHLQEIQDRKLYPDGHRCQSKFQMQFDHIVAFSKNGGAELGNIQHLCRVHNDYKGAK